MVKKVIFNADDFGASIGVNLGIIDAHQYGVLTSTTLLINMPHTEHAIALAKNHPNLGIGLHLNLTLGQPVTKNVPSLTDADGNFYHPTSIEFKEMVINQDELEAEWRGQIEQFIQLAGRIPTHLDSHHHVHMDINRIPVIQKLAKEFGIPVRQTHKKSVAKIQTDFEQCHFYGGFFGENLKIADIINPLKNLDDTIEFMCHPAYLDQHTYDMSSYRLPRINEQALLCDLAVKAFIENNNIQLINYSHLKKEN